MIDKNKAIENAKKEVVVKKRRLEALELQGPLYVSPEHKKAGFHYQFVDATTPGTVDRYERLGFTVVKRDINVGDGKPNDSSRFGSAVTVQSRDSILLVLMEIPLDIFEEIEEERREMNAKIMDDLKTIPGIDARHQYGEIHIKK